MSNLKDLLQSAAPWLANAVGGPLAGIAVKAIGEALGQPDASTEAVTQALTQATPDQLLSLKQADADFELKMRELGLNNIERLEEIAAGDRDSARKREMEVKDSTPRVLAYLITGGFFGLLLLLLFKQPPLGSADTINDMLNVLGTVWIGCVSYYFGTTANSQRKTDMLHKSRTAAD